ncbi:contractile injection system tape measure protein [Aquimarina sp. RZ0]|uniref:contractile injection system tape measure protein n=1 Tax=Aquimarina sp. RZ0 TaxID=2607730 RepID=UPI0011F0BF44|nr:contractile injection system tape measure protein [Aquimarina sp. RZ0]KAA1248049.1 hypothetical protein F0000_00190 [Aquimarina sp. RZ0]
MHTIENITVNWKLTNIRVQENIETKCNRIIQDRLFPKMEMQLDAWNSRNPGMKCIIPEININILCTEFSTEIIEHLFLRQFNYLLEEKTKNAQKNKTNTNNSTVLILKSPTVKDFILQYLQKGYTSNTNETKEIKEWVNTPTKIDDDFISKSIHIISADPIASIRFVSIFTKIEAIDELLFKKTGFYKSSEFVVILLQAITRTIFPEKPMDTQIEIWKTVLISSPSLERCIQTLYTIFQPIVSFRYNTRETIFLLAALLLYTKCQLDSKKYLNITHSIKNIFNPPNSPNGKNIDTSSKNKDALGDIKTIKKQESLDSSIKTIEEKIRKKQEELHPLKNTSLNDNKEEENQTISLKKQLDTTSEDMLNPQSIYKDVKTIDASLISDNIGLFILHPFLKEFFTETRVLKSSKIIDPNKGVQLLHYLATGSDACKDISVLTEKIIVGIPIQQTIFIEAPLSNEEKKCCDVLLKAVLKHWIVLEKSGIDTLRSMFLVREGTIVLKEKSIRIEATHLAQDILLKKLPWGLGMIVLPWSKRIFQITWKS